MQNIWITIWKLTINSAWFRFSITVLTIIDKDESKKLHCNVKAPKMGKDAWLLLLFRLESSEEEWEEGQKKILGMHHYLERIKVAFSSTQMFDFQIEQIRC